MVESRAMAALLRGGDGRGRRGGGEGAGPGVGRMTGGLEAGAGRTTGGAGGVVRPTGA